MKHIYFKKNISSQLDQINNIQQAKELISKLDIWQIKTLRKFGKLETTFGYFEFK